MRIFCSILNRNHWIQDPEDSIFKLAVMLVNITNRITAEVFREYEIDRLHDLVIDYLVLRETLVEEFPLLGSPKPKHHFLLHYSENIKKFGPPLGFWTARFESKHRVAKSTADNTKNFRNISKTIASRQQLRCDGGISKILFLAGIFQLFNKM